MFPRPSPGFAREEAESERREVGKRGLEEVGQLKCLLNLRLSIHLACYPFLF